MLFYRSNHCSFLQSLLLSLSIFTHVVEAPLERVRPPSDSGSVPVERRLRRAVLEEARPHERVERRVAVVGSAFGDDADAAAAASPVLVLAPAPPAPQDLAAAGKRHDGVEHGV